MADRTAAHIFGQIFHLLAQNPTEENKKAALIIYGLIDNFDFSPQQMYVESDLRVLGLCQRTRSFRA